MAMRVGEMMVIIRAQDFASRTLRRVSGEFAHMSREQAMAEAGRQAAANKATAQTRVAIAESNRRRLSYVKEGTALRNQLAESTQMLERYDQARRVAMPTGRFGKATRAEMQEFQNAADALHKAGLRSVHTYNRIQKAQAALTSDLEALTRAQNKFNAAQAAVPPPRTKGRAAAIVELNMASQALAEVQGRVKDSTREVKNAERAFKSLGGVARSQVADWLRLNRQVTNFDSMLSRLPAGLQRAAQNMTAMGDATFRSNQALKAAYDGLDRATKAQIAYNEALKRMPAERLDALARSMSGIGRTMQLFGAVGTVALGLLANQAAEFNTQISLAATQARDIGGSAAQVQERIGQLTNGFKEGGTEIKGVLDLMKQYPSTAEEMTQATYDIFSGMNLEEEGIMNVAKGLGLLEDANKIAVAGGVDLADATSAMITVLNNFDPHLQNTTEQFDTMFDIVRFGRMTMSDFNVMMNKIAPAAADAGMELEEVGGAMAYLTTVMPSQRMVATGISRLLEALRHPDVTKGLKMFGVETMDLVNGGLRPLEDILTDLTETDFGQAMKEGRMSAQEFFRMISAAGRGGGKGVIFTQEGRRALSEIITHFDEYLLRQRQIENNTGEFARSHADQMKSLGVQWGIFKNQVKALGIAIGTDIIPVFTDLGKHIQTVLDWWQDLSPETRKTIAQFAVLVSIGSLLGGVFLAVIGGLMAFEATIRRVAMGVGGASGTLGALLMVLRRIAAIGIITIVIKLLKGGDMGLWDALGAAGMGALLGSRFGPGGAVLGAITVPLVLKVIEIKKGGGFAQDISQGFQQRAREYFEESKKLTGVTKANALQQHRYNKYLAKTYAMYKGGPEGFKAWEEQIMTPAEFKKFEARFAAIDKVERNRTRTHNDQLKQQENADKKAANTYKDSLTKYYEALQAYDENQKDFARRLKEWRNQLAQATEQGAKTAVDNLRNMYMQMRQVNETELGTLFEGPWMGGEPFDIAKEWGIVPRFEDMLKDLQMRNAEFRKWRAGIDSLLKKGVPKDFIDQLRAKGMEEGLPMMEQILKATPKQRQKLIKAWQDGQKLVEQATKFDFSAEIKAMIKGGVDMGKAIIDGFEAAKVGMFFDTWVTTKFPNIINAAVNEAVRRWKAANPKPEPPTKPIKPTPPAPRVKGATKPGEPVKPKVQRGVVAANSITHGDTDNSKNMTIHVTVQGQMHPGAEDIARAVAFNVKNAMMGKF